MPRRTTLLVVALALAGAMLPASTTASIGDGAFLTALAGRARPEAPTSGPAVAVAVDTSALPGRSGGTVPIDLLGVEVALEMRAERSSNGGRVWRGTVAGLPGDAAFVVEHEGVVMGSIETSDGRLVIGTDRTGVQYAHLVDRSEVPDEGDDMVDMTPPADGEPAPRTAQTRAGARIDVLMAYTPAFRNAVGGKAQAIAFAAARVAEMNTVAANSGMSTRFRLVTTMQVSYNESGDIHTDLDRLRLKSDGHLDAVHAMRDLYGADVAQLLVETGGCGVGYRLRTFPVSSFESLAFSVAGHFCAEVNYTSTHEVGHNLGSTHDRGNPPDPTKPPLFDYSWGHRVIGSFSTVMSYNNDANGCSGTCPRQPYFSNPGVSLFGHPTGVPVSDPAAAHNKKGFDSIAADAAAWRPTVRTCDGEPATHVGTPGDDVIVGTSGDDVIVGLGGDDVIKGMGGNDILCGNSGRDTLRGGGGHDLMFGGPHRDLIAGQRGGDEIHGGGASDDLRGGGGGDTILGQGGHDTILGQNGHDTIDGGPGDDTAHGGLGNDTCVRVETTTSC